MKWREMTDRETTATMIVMHIVHLCTRARSSAIPLSVATTESMAGALAPWEQAFFQSAISAAVEHKMLGLQGANVGLTQFGQVVTAFATLIGTDRKNFEDQTDGHPLIEHFVAVAAKEPRFDPPKPPVAKY